MRTLSDELRVINGSIYRNYRFELVLWDVLSTGAPTPSQIIAGTADASFSLDVTDVVNNGLQIEEPGDRRASRMTFTITANDNSFNPQGGVNARFVKDGCLARFREGDLNVPLAEWVYTFTGHIKGQAGFTINRGARTQQTEVTAYGRRATARYNKLTFTSQNYSRFTDYGQIILDIAINVMGLTLSEVTRISTFLRKTTQFASNSIVDLTPLDAIDKILESVGLTSDFDGEGIMRFYDRDMTRSPDKIYDDLDLLPAVTIPAADVHIYNSVSVTGLDKNITETQHPGEELARASLTAGFWRPRERARVQWSEDRSTRATNTELEVIQSIRDSLVLGGFGNESYNALDEFSGEIVVDITGYVGGLIALIVISLAAKAAIGDIAPPFGGITIPVGKILEAIVHRLINMATSTVSTGQYLIRGTVLIPVFKELAVVVTENGVPDFLLNQKDIRNDWLTEQNEILQIAQLELIFEHAQGEPREYEVINDLELEIGDIVFIPIGGGLRIWIDSLAKTVGRGVPPVMRVTGYRAL